jgi:nicotinate-nucleotide adenylyltransferase
MRVGVFGGTFDPIHLGHLAVARSIQSSLGLDNVIFVPGTAKGF